MPLGEHKLAPQSKSSRRYAFAFSAGYLVVTYFYAQMSTMLLAGIAKGSVERFERLESIKDGSFMILTAIGFYFTIRWVSKRIARTERELHETHERWAEAERQAAPALFASVIAHDVANLLTVLRLSAEKLKRLPSMPEAAFQWIAKLNQSTDRLMELVKRLRGVSSALFNEEPHHFDFSKSVAETLRLMDGHVSCEKAAIELVSDTRVELRGYPVLIHQLVMNLLINAAEATGRVGRVRFTILNSENGVSLVVDDNGPGIEPSLREKVLNSFFTTKTLGTGLGLTSVRTCVEIHQGFLQITDSPDLGGARFLISLPNLTNSRVEELRHPERKPQPRAPELTH